MRKRSNCRILLTVLMALIYPFSGSLLADVPDTLKSGTYAIVYSSALRVPMSVDWVLQRSDIGTIRREPSWRFIEDTRVPRPRACHSDYSHSGFDRGHIVPAADRSASISAMRSTFIMTNVCPQVPSLNRGSWKRLEDGCRAIAKQGQALHIHVDALFWQADTQRIGRDSVAVPHAFVKSVYSWPADSLLYSRYFQNY